MTVKETRADMSTADINDLPDSAFAYIEPGGKKDSDGKTTPRSLRHFPVHDADHVRNALARAPQSPFGDKAMPAIKAAARKFGIEVSGDDSRSARSPDTDKRTLRGRRANMWSMLAGQVERRRRGFSASQFELRAMPDGTGGSMYELNCYGSTFNDPFEMWDLWGDPYVEVVRPGAFTRSLAREDLDVPLLLGHNDMGAPFARTSNGKMRLGQDSCGLHVNAQRLNGSRSDVRDMVIAVEDGDLSEVSIGFVTMPGGQRWSTDYTTREMLDLDLHRGDVSLVALAANPATKGATMTAMPGVSAWRAPWNPGMEKRLPTQPYQRGADEHVTCIQCGSGNDADARYCDQCGTGMRPLMDYVTDPDDTQECACGSWNAPDAKICDQCGSSLVNDHDADDGYLDWWKSRRPGEQRAARGEINDSSNQPDFNLPAGTPAYDASAHGKNSLACPHNDCPVYDGGDGARALNAKDARFCDQCGGPLYNADGLIVADDNGVVEEVGGDMADADLLSRRLRLLELA